MLQFQDTCEVYYDTPKLEYTYTSIYGFYEKQNGTINGKNWYRNSGNTIWWEYPLVERNSTLFLVDGYGMWFLGNKTKNSNASSYGYAHTDLVDNGTDIQTVDWRLISEDTKNDIWNYAGKKLKIRCEFQQRRSKYPPFQNSATYILPRLDCNKRYCFMGEG